MTPRCPGRFLNFNLGLLLHSPVLIAVSHPVLEFQRIGEVCVSKIDFLISHLYPAVCYSAQPSASESQRTM